MAGTPTSSLKSATISLVCQLLSGSSTSKRLDLAGFYCRSGVSNRGKDSDRRSQRAATEALTKLEKAQEEYTKSTARVKRLVRIFGKVLGLVGGGSTTELLLVVGQAFGWVVAALVLQR